MAETLGMAVAAIIIVVALIFMVVPRQIMYPLQEAVRRAMRGKGQQHMAARRSEMVDRIQVDDHECVACGSRDLNHPAPGAYQCRACGYEGGSGREDMKKQQMRAEWESVPLPHRAKAAIEDLVAARSLLDETTIDGKIPVDKSRMAASILMSPYGGGRGDIDSSEEEERGNRLMQAAKLMQDAQTKLSGLDVIDAEANYTGIVADIAPVDYPVVAQRLLREVNEAIAGLMKIKDAS